MATLTVPSQTWAGTQTYGPVALPPGIHNVRIAPDPGSANDWTTGAGGRTVTATFEDDNGPGGAWQQIAQITMTTPRLDRNGNPVGGGCGTGDGWPGGHVRVVAAFSAAVRCGFLITYG
jgi:hypothetical protein